MASLPQNRLSPDTPFQSFAFRGHRFDSENGTIFLSYNFSPDGPAFEERIVLGPSKFKADMKALNRVLRLLHIAAGISYYKAYTPRDLTGADVSADEAAFFSKFYREGLGEFAHRNGLNISDYKFFSASERVDERRAVDLPERALVLVGGGKDSVVSVETLRAAGDDITLFAVNPAKPIKDCMEKAGLPVMTVTRTLDAQLFELNKQCAYNGHVPITGIISFIATAAALWHGYNKIILSNERSANEPTVDGVNHQYSKSQDFESDFIKLMGNAPAYESLLRPLSEIGIARLFAKTDRYDSVFTSCNKAYSITNPMMDKRWCGACPKCLFVYLSLATALPRARLRGIFGKDLLDDAELIEGYRALSGLVGQKPWECVGEILESAAALYALSQNAEWKDAAIIAALKNDLVSQYGTQKLDAEYQRALSFADAPTLDTRDLEKLKRYAR